MRGLSGTPSSRPRRRLQPPPPGAHDRQPGPEHGLQHHPVDLGQSVLRAHRGYGKVGSGRPAGEGGRERGTGQRQDREGAEPPPNRRMVEIHRSGWSRARVAQQEGLSPVPTWKIVDADRQTPPGHFINQSPP